MGTSLPEQLRRYDAVIHLRTPAPDQGYDRANPLRIESPAEAMAIDELIARAWEGHPRRFTIEAVPDFFEKAKRAAAVLEALVPECCRSHFSPALGQPPKNASTPQQDGA